MLTWCRHAVDICRQTHSTILANQNLLHTVKTPAHRYMFKHMFDMHQHVQICGLMCSDHVDMMSTCARHMPTHSITDSCKLKLQHIKWHSPVRGVRTYFDMQYMSTWCWNDAKICQHTFTIWRSNDVVSIDICSDICSTCINMFKYMVRYATMSTCCRHSVDICRHTQSPILAS